ncbi:MAG: HEAT repeat domain-containing protein [Acidobacteriota bacterium]
MRRRSTCRSLVTELIARPKPGRFVTTALVAIGLVSCLAPRVGAQSRTAPTRVLARILQLEDNRDSGEGELARLLNDERPEVRERAALALGRIGDKKTTPALCDSLRRDKIERIRLMAAFALGELEDPAAIDTLMTVVDTSSEPVVVRARAVEALGKIASLQSADSPLADRISLRVVSGLRAPEATATSAERLMTLLAITALMRLRSPASVAPLAQLLGSHDAEVRAQAANALARLRRPTAAAVPQLLSKTTDPDGVVRANVARALGLTADRNAPDRNPVDALVKLLGDPDDRVRVSAARGLASLGDNRAVTPLVVAGDELLDRFRSNSAPEANVLLEFSTALGALKDEKAVAFLRKLRTRTGAGANPEVEIALARLSRDEFFEPLSDFKSDDWRRVANVAQGLGEIDSDRSRAMLTRLLAEATSGRIGPRSVPVILRALKKVKVDDLTAILLKQLAAEDIGIRAAAAQLLAGDKEDETIKALIVALDRSRTDAGNDARIALVETLSPVKSEETITAIKSFAKDRDYLVRKQVAEALQKSGEKELNAEPVGTGRSLAWYESAIRRGRTGRIAVIETDKGRVTVELFGEDAPLTVENFATLAERGYFNGIAFHRVVPNFVVQGGDPQGDGEGSPGVQIRCEINLRPYVRGAVGMALSGKDTGGSQFFVTHAPQPHLDGGYTVFGQVVSGMEVVDRITRGDVIRRVTIHERGQRKHGS